MNYMDLRPYNILSTIAVNQILLYLRKSRQDDPMETVEEVLARHEMQLQDFAMRTFGARIPEGNIYREIVSGETIEDRPEIGKVLERIQDSEIRAVMVIEPQRLTRGDLLDLGTMVHSLRYTQTICITPGKTFNLDDKYDRRQFEDELKRGNDYLEYTKEILDRGRRASVMQGYWIASNAPFGYDKELQKNKKTILVQNEDAKYVKMIFEMYAQGIGRNTIALELDRLGVKTPGISRKWQTTSIRAILENDAYIGFVRYGEKTTIRTYVDGKLVRRKIKAAEEKSVVAKGRHVPIIEMELWNRVQAMLGRTNKAKKNAELNNVFAGLLFCKRCGYAMRLMKGKRYIYNRYYCASARLCDCQAVTEPEVLDAIKQALESNLDEVQVQIENGNIGEREKHLDYLRRMEKKQEKLKERESVLYDLLENGTYSAEEFSSRRAKLRQEMDEIHQDIETARETLPEEIDYHDAVARLQAAIAALDDESMQTLEKNTLLKAIIERIEYFRDKPENSKEPLPFSVDVFLRV